MNNIAATATNTGILHTTRYGRKLWMEEGSWLATRLVDRRNPYQSKNLRALQRLVPHSRLTLDVGANVGMNTIEYAQFSDQVWSWEPHPQTFEFCKRNMVENNITNATLYNAAAGDVAGLAHIIEYRCSDGCNRIARAGNDKDHTNGPVTVVNRVDDFHPQNVDIIKIDAEGYELKVLAGAETTIDRCRPVVQCEIESAHLKKYGGLPQDVFDWFLTRDYLIQNYKGENRAPIWEKEKGILDYIFVPKDRNIN